MNEAQAIAGANEQVNPAPKPTLLVQGITQVKVAPIVGFEDLLATAGKVANLTQCDSVDQVLAASASVGILSASLHSSTSPIEAGQVLQGGISAALSALFQLAAVEGISAAALTEGVRLHLEKEAQAAAKTGIVEFFQERGLTA